MKVADESKTKMDQVIDHLKSEFKSLRTGRVNPHMLDDVKVESYGSMMPLKSLGSISVQERNLVVTPFDPSISAGIIKAISQAPHLKLNAVQEGGQIRVPVPALTEEVRKETAKQAKQKAEAAKVAIREVRKKYNEAARKLKAESLMTEDELKKCEKVIQDMTDKHCKEIDELFTAKEKEIMTI